MRKGLMGAVLAAAALLAAAGCGTSSRAGTFVPRGSAAATPAATGPATPGLVHFPFPASVHIEFQTPAPADQPDRSVVLTDEDFQQVLDGGNFVTKVIYLPDPRFQELAVSGVETLVSTRLEPGVDPILEADKRGTILLIVRVGAIDLETPGGGSVLAGGGVEAPPQPGGTVITSPMPAGAPGAIELPPGALPPGAVPAPPVVPGTVVLDAPAQVPAAAPVPGSAGPIVTTPTPPPAPAAVIPPPPRP